ncbi:hypothetical protein ABIB25_003110 [Nakamurella sp. UYEF19]
MMGYLSDSRAVLYAQPLGFGRFAQPLGFGRFAPPRRVGRFAEVRGRAVCAAPGVGRCAQAGQAGRLSRRACPE